jgi:ABC-type Na+ efflux pump permease subunit
MILIFLVWVALAVLANWLFEKLIGPQTIIHFILNTLIPPLAIITTLFVAFIANAPDFRIFKEKK